MPATRPAPTAVPAAFGPRTTAVEPCSTVPRSIAVYVTADSERPSKKATRMAATIGVKATRAERNRVRLLMLILPS